MKNQLSARVRQDRLELDDHRCFLRLGETSFEIINISPFGLAIISDPNAAFDENVPFSAELILAGNLFQKVDLSYVRKEQLSSSKVKIAFKTINSTIRSEPLSLWPQVGALIDSTHLLADLFNEIPSTFKCQVFEMKETLELYEKKVTVLERNLDPSSYHEKIESEKLILESLGPVLCSFFEENNRELNSKISSESEAIRKKAIGFYQKVLGPLIHRSSFAKRSYEKPRGYAGDFEMMNQVYRNEDYSKDLFGRCIERAIQMHSEPKAVRSRAAYLESKITNLLLKLGKNKGQRIKILSVACGPANEILRLIENADEHMTSLLKSVSFYLLDQDPGALQEAQKKIVGACLERKIDCEVHLLLKPIKELIAEGLNNNDYQLIYSAGLFDYFTDAVVRQTFLILLASVTKKGTLIIGNFDSKAPNYFGMQTMFDWNLILRSEEDLTKLFETESSRVKIEKEENRVNLFAVIEKDD